MSTMRDRFAAAWGALVDWWIGRRAVKTVDACALYFGKVVAVSGAKVDVQLDTDQIASPTGVPLYLGLPGCTAACLGARVLVGFRNGDPSQPYAIGFEQSSPMTAIEIGTSSPQPAARQNDAVNGGTVTATAPPGGGAVVFTYTPAGGAPGAPGPTLLLTGGKITGGSSAVKIGG